MITCIVTHEIEPSKPAEFETHAPMRLHLIPRMSGTHQGRLPPHEGADDRAWALLSRRSRAACGDDRGRMSKDPECLADCRHAEETGCIHRHDRTFARPMTEGASPADLGVPA